MTNSSLVTWLALPGHTQKKLARACGVREATVSAWMRGVVPKPDMMQRVEAATGGGVPVASWFAAEHAA